MRGTMQNSIQSLIAQLRALRKCGISTIFAPGVLADAAARRQWSVKAVALLNGYTVEDFDGEGWKRVMTAISLDSMSLSGQEGFTPEERDLYQPLLQAAEELYEVVASQSSELAGRTIAL